MTKIQLRHDTSTRWQTANPILAPGEVGVETDTQKIKVGNGSTAYNSLQYIGTTRVTNETNLNNIIEPGTYYFSGTRWSNLTNKPFNDSSHTVAWMIVISYNSGNTAQILFSGKGDYSDCDFAIRYRISSNWNSWHYVRPTSVLSYNVPNGLVVLDSSGKLPAVDGSQLTNLPGGESSDSLNVYQLQYGAQSGSIPVTFNGNNITIKSGIPISTPNGTFSYTSDITYQYTFESERTIFAYKDGSDESYYNMLAVYYGGSQPATNPQGQIAWFDNNVWKMISATGEITTFSTQLITPIAKVYLNGNNVKSIDYASYYKIDISNPTPSNMVTTDTAQTITGSKTFNEPVTIEGSLISSEADLTIQKSSASAAVIKFGERGATIKGDSSDICYLRETVIQPVVPIQAAYILDADKPYYLHQNSITAGSDNLVISKTDTGIQITCNAPTGALKYWTGIETDYTAINTKDPDTLYRTTDTNKVFLGTIQLGG